jgi:hypothetical protein
MPRIDRPLHNEDIKNKVRRGNKIFRIPASIKTVDDLFVSDDVNGVLNAVIADKANITDMIILYKTRDGSICEEHTPELKSSTAIYMCEICKFDILQENTADTED